MGARLLFLVLGAMLISSPATAGTYSWGTVAAPSRVAGTDLTGVVSIQALPGTNGTVQQCYVDSDGFLHTRSLAAGRQTGSTPPTGTAVSGGLGRLLQISGALAVGPSFDDIETVQGGAVYFPGDVCTEDWTCRYGAFMRTCIDAACSRYRSPAQAIGFPHAEARIGWVQNVAASPDGWLFLLRGQKDRDTGNNPFFEVWARNVQAGSRAVRLAANSVAGIPLSGSMEFAPGAEGQLTIVFPDSGRAALYVPALGWRALP
jgi:hypothetical protein